MPLTDDECLAIGFDRAAFMARARPYSHDRRQPTSLYVMQSGKYLKVGIAGDVTKRLAAIQTANPEPVKLRHTREFSSRLYALMVEAEAHRSLAAFHVHSEWFSADLAHVRRILALIYPCMASLERRYAAEEAARFRQLQERYATDAAFRAEHDEMMAHLTKAVEEGRHKEFKYEVNPDDLAALQAMSELHEIRNRLTGETA